MTKQAMHGIAIQPIQRMPFLDSQSPEALAPLMRILSIWHPTRLTRLAMRADSASASLERRR